MEHGSRATLVAMANLTITVDAETLKRARIRALERGESVNAYLADMLERYAGGQTQADITAGFLDLAERYRAASGSQGRTWTREGLYDERFHR